jgi:hypothetical protein
MCFLGLDLSDAGPDANTIWTIREALTKARIGGKPAIEVLLLRLDHLSLLGVGYENPMCSARVSLIGPSLQFPDFGRARARFGQRTHRSS